MYWVNSDKIMGHLTQRAQKFLKDIYNSHSWGVESKEMESNTLQF